MKTALVLTRIRRAFTALAMGGVALACASEDPQPTGLSSTINSAMAGSAATLTNDNAGASGNVSSDNLQNAGQSGVGVGGAPGSAASRAGAPGQSGVGNQSGSGNALNSGGNLATSVGGTSGLGGASGTGEAGATSLNQAGSGQGGLGSAGAMGVAGDTSLGVAGDSSVGGGMGLAGATNAGAGGATGTGGTSGAAPVNPSSGCGMANPPTGSSQSPLNVANHQYYVKLPSSYDPNTPYLLLFVFHPTNNPLNWAEQNAGFEQGQAAAGAIRVYPGAANNASGWGASDVSLFDPLYEQMVNNYCVDQARVFATGESSGGDYASILGCEFADKLRAVGPAATKPVNGYPLNAGQRSCTGQVGAVVIHGLNDNVVGPANGPATRDFYKELNHCGDATTPVEGYTDSLSNCVSYEGCDEGYPVIWCGHQDPEYSGTNHGWPKFAGRMLWEHFSSY